MGYLNFIYFLNNLRINDQHADTAQRRLPLKKKVDPKMGQPYVTCLALELHRVAETIRKQYPDVDSLISRGKEIFRKCPYRIIIFEEKAPGLPLRPRPRTTRWDQLFYRSSLIHGVECIFLNSTFCKRHGGKLLNTAQTCFVVLKKSDIEAQLTYITANFMYSKFAILELEKNGSQLTDSVQVRF